MRARVSPGDFNAEFEDAQAKETISADVLHSERQQPPDGWSAALQRLWSHVMRHDKLGGLANDPLTPLTARLLLTAAQPDAEGSKLPTITKRALMELLDSSTRLEAACKALTAGVREQFRSSNILISKTAIARLDELVERGTTLAFVAVRRMFAHAGLPVSLWDELPCFEVVQGGVLRLPPTTTPEELWKRAVKPHRPCIISGICDNLLVLFRANHFCPKYARDAIPVRTSFETDSEGRRLFLENKPEDVCSIPNQKRVSEAQKKNLAFLGGWYRDAQKLGLAEGEEDEPPLPTVDKGGWSSNRPPPAASEDCTWTRDVYCAKISLRLWCPVLETELMYREDTPYARFSTCLGPMNSDGIFMYAGAGHNATATHFDAAEGFVLMGKGTKTYQLFAPAECEHMYPCPAPKYHSSAVPPFSDPATGLSPHPEYTKARPITVTLEAGDFLYIPACWYYCECGYGGGPGGVGLNVTFHWWASIHPNKRDDAPKDMPYDDEVDYTKGLQGNGHLVDIIEEGVFMQGP